MIERLKTITSESTIPYENIALETCLLHQVDPGTCILYLWQNRHTVVIGKNQNSWKECRLNDLEKSGGYLARRLSGGGAVFHDLGNLNFTFLAKKEDYDVEKQTEVILQAVRMYGIQAERTGRNDMAVGGRKFSGNAFYQTGDLCCHHGTILIDVDKQNMSRYLHVSTEKLKSKGVDSVRSRVTNLVDHNPEVSVDGMKERMVQAFALVYGKEVTKIKREDILWEEVAAETKRFASWEWNYGRKIPFQHQVEKRYPWGDVQIQIEVNEGVIREIMCYSDGLDVWVFQQLTEALKGQKYCPDILADRIVRMPVQDELQQQMKTDIAALLCEMG